MATTEIGSAGLSHSYGSISEEFNPKLQGRAWINVIREMEVDSVVGAIMFAIEMLIRQVDWRVDKEEADAKNAEFLESCMNDMSMSWGDFISEAFSMLLYGWSFHEIVYKKRQGPQKEGSKIPSSLYNDGRTGWRKLPIRAQESLDRWELDDQGGVIGMIQRPAPTYEERIVPIEKALLFRTRIYKGNPEGRSVLRTSYVPWFYKRKIQQIEGTGIERDLAGFPVFWIPAEFLTPDATPEQTKTRQMFEKLGENIRRDKQEFVIMPLAYDSEGNKAYDFTLMSSGGSRSFNTSEIIARYNREIAMTVLADFILLGHENVGSFALSSDKTDLFAVALGTFLDVVSDVLNRYAVPRLFELNGLPLDKLPKIVHGDIDTPDLAVLGQYITALSNAGVPLFPDDELEDWLRQQGNLPELSKETKKLREKKEQEPDDDGGEDGAIGSDSQSGGNSNDPIGELERRQTGGKPQAGSQQG